MHFGDLTTDILQYVSQATTTADRADGGMERMLCAYHQELLKVHAAFGTATTDVITFPELT